MICKNVTIKNIIAGKTFIYKKTTESLTQWFS